MQTAKSCKIVKNFKCMYDLSLLLSKVYRKSAKYPRAINRTTTSKNAVFSLSCTKNRFRFYAFFPLFRNMLQDHKNILKCLRGKRFEDLTKYAFETPSFLIAMGPSRDGVLIPADFDIVHKRAHSTNYQV